MKTLPNDLNLKFFGKPNSRTDAATEFPNVPLEWLDGFDDWVAAKYKDLEARLEFVYEDIDPIPSHFQGPLDCWTVYDGSDWLEAELPDAGVYDFETCKYADGLWYPICCTGWGSDRRWYQYRVRHRKIYPQLVIPFRQDALVLGWNVNYDLAYFAERYSPHDNGIRGLDLMGLHKMMHQYSNQQQGLYQLKKNNPDRGFPGWLDEACGASLKEAAYFHFGQEVDKSIRHDLTEMNWGEWPTSYNAILKYNCEDIVTTLKLAKRLIGKARIWAPDPISWLGMLEMGNEYIPLHPEFKRWAALCAAYTDKIQERHSELLQSLVPEFEKPDYNDGLDWELAKSGKNKGQPAWKRKVKDYTLTSRFTPIVLGMHWNGRPLCWRTDPDNSRTGSWGTYDQDNIFRKIPHPKPDKPNKNVASPFCKDYEDLVEAGVITSNREDIDLVKIYDEYLAVTNWVSLEKRVFSTPIYNNAVCPQLQVVGTQSRRATDPLWKVGNSPKKNRAGTELMAKVQAPDGWVFVGADFASEEAWLLALLGRGLEDKFLKAIVLGTKENKQDWHTLVQLRMNGINRTYAKNLNYALGYGAGHEKRVAMLRSYVTGKDEAWYQNMITAHTVANKGRKHHGRWYGGLMSAQLNELARLAEADGNDARTLTLKVRIPLPLDVVHTSGEYLTTRQNWWIQSWGVDCLHLLLTSIAYLRERVGIELRLSFTVHDSARHLAKVEDKYKAALVYQVAHFNVASRVYKSAGYDTMHVERCWFPDIDIDPLGRKEAKMDYVTPTSPKGFPLGESLKIEDVLQHNGL